MHLIVVTGKRAKSGRRRSFTRGTWPASSSCSFCFGPPTNAMHSLIVWVSVVFCLEVDCRKVKRTTSSMLPSYCRYDYLTPLFINRPPANTNNNIIHVQHYLVHELPLRRNSSKISVVHLTKATYNLNHSPRKIVTPNPQRKNNN